MTRDDLNHAGTERAEFWRVENLLGFVLMDVRSHLQR